MNIEVLKECPHCSKRLANALDHWSKNFSSRAIHDDFADEISELLSDQADAIRLLHSYEYQKPDTRIMKLDKQDTEQLMDLCQWILDYDKNLPFRDGDRTSEVVRMAHTFSRLIDTHEDES